MDRRSLRRMNRQLRSEAQRSDAPRLRLQPFGILRGEEGHIPYTKQEHN